MDIDQFRRHGKKLQLIIPDEKIQQRNLELAKEIQKEIAGQNYIALGILNGVFMFLSDIVKHFTFHDLQLDFIKLASYKGTQSTNQVNELIGLRIPVQGRNVIIFDDILETGQTLDKMIKLLKDQGAAQIKICVLLHKVGKLKVDIKPDFVGFEIEDYFVIGYGLDWDDSLRELKDIYIAVNE